MLSHSVSLSRNPSSGSYAPSTAHSLEVPNHSAELPAQDSTSEPSHQAPSYVEGPPREALHRLLKSAPLCGICRGYANNGHVGGEGGCGHTYCVECFEEHVQEQCRRGFLSILCPAQGCTGRIGEDIVARILQSAEAPHRAGYLTGQFPCPSPRCVVPLDLSRIPARLAKQPVDCPHCGSWICLWCRSPYHPALLCGENMRLRRSLRPLGTAPQPATSPHHPAMVHREPSPLNRSFDSQPRDIGGFPDPARIDVAEIYEYQSLGTAIQIPSRTPSPSPSPSPSPISSIVSPLLPPTHPKATPKTASSPPAVKQTTQAKPLAKVEVNIVKTSNERILTPQGNYCIVRGPHAMECRDAINEALLVHIHDTSKNKSSVSAKWRFKFISEKKCGYCGRPYVSLKVLAAHLRTTTQHPVHACCYTLFYNTAAINTHRALIPPKNQIP